MIRNALALFGAEERQAAAESQYALMAGAAREKAVGPPDGAKLVGFSVPFARADIFEAGPDGRLLRSVTADQDGKFPEGSEFSARERVEIIYPSEGKAERSS